MRSEMRNGKAIWANNRGRMGKGGGGIDLPGDNYLLIKIMTTGTLEGSINEIKGLLDGN